VRIVPPRPDPERIPRMSILAIALLGILLLAALVAFGLGQSRWSWASVAASFLLVLTLAGYLYLASRLLAQEWKWVRSVRSAKARLHEFEYARNAGPDAAPADMSLETLGRVRDRWQRAIETIDTWRGRRWQAATFDPPAADGETGTIELRPPPREQPAEGEPEAPTEPAAVPAGTPLDPGMTLYVFDDTPISEGGKYLGSFIVEEVAPSAGGGQTVTVRQTAPRDSRDAALWQRSYDDVSVFDQLPTDRWTAFSATPGTAADGTEDADAIAPRPTMRDAAALEELVAEPFRRDVERHVLTGDTVREPIEKAEWPSIRESLEQGTVLPGEYWAQATFGDAVDRDAFLGIDGGGGSLTVEMELGTAFALEDEGKATIDRVFFRRRLLDAETIVHGSVMPGGDGAGGDILADGLAGIMRSLNRDIAALEASNRQLEASQQSAEAERQVLRSQAEDLTADLTNWERDVTAAERTARAFEAAVEAARKRLAEAERQVVELGQILDADVDRAVEEIDLVAPPPGGRPSAPL
jgi:FtsZ-binding cell division protein ZapB